MWVLLRMLIVLGASLGIALGLGWVTPPGESAPGAARTQPEAKRAALRAPAAAPIDTARSAVPRPAASHTAAPSPAALGLVLVGTAVGASPSESVASFEDRSGQVHVHRSGEWLSGKRARIAEIGPRHVVLEHAGVRVELAIQDGRERAARPADEDVSAAELFERPLDRLQQEPAERKRPALDVDQAVARLAGMGELSTAPGGSAIRVERLAADSPLARIGLLAGDRILKVDGVATRGAQALPQLAAALYASGGSTVLTVRRADGSRVQLAMDGGALLEPTLDR